ncbi:MAG: bifunctional hydroxymethylpyrimidine kinase/phosphomethylpyrimidine kinase [Ignavibacteria bacterium]
MAKKIKCVLTIAGSDSGAGAGIQSDLKTFHNHGVYGLTVITAVTSQNTFGVQSSFELPVDIIKSQLKSVFDDFDINVVKTGMLSSKSIILSISNYFKNKVIDLNKIKLIVDPVIFSKNQFRLLSTEGVESLKSNLLPLSYLVTPNLVEAEFLSGVKIRTIKELEKAVKKIHALGCKNVLIKGGHLQKKIGIDKGTDILFNSRKFYLFKSKFKESKNTHGVGCTFSAAIASNIALGKSLIESISLSKAYVVESLERTQKLGGGIGPVEQL